MARKAALVLATAIATGCSINEHAAMRPLPVISQTAGAAEELALPLDSHELSPAGNNQVRRATLRLLRECLESFGLDVPLPEAREAKYPTHATQLNWLGVYDVAEYGYQGPPDFAAEMSAATRRGTQPIVIPSEAVPVFIGDVAVYFGRPVPNGGCDGRSQRILNGGEDPPRIDVIDPTVPPEQGIQWLEQNAADRARADDRFRAVTDQWSKCMHRYGYRYSTPDEAQSDPRWSELRDPTHPSPSRDEIDTAIADRTCRELTNMSGVLKHLMVEQEEGIIRTHPNTVQQISALLRRRVDNAARILGEVSDQLSDPESD
ncbi:hypothetical protein AB0C02_33020 [Micromonospora sp. NPDC048999]|uniref:hypothetical protein n=1 Tax=Micromonospora sp. NPDC048999 TaxID=3155391 RepID=UPI0033D06A9B